MPQSFTYVSPGSTRFTRWKAIPVMPAGHHTKPVFRILCRALKAMAVKISAGQAGQARRLCPEPMNPVSLSLETRPSTIDLAGPQADTSLAPVCGKGRA